VVAVWHAFGGVEEFPSSGHVELGSGFGSQGQVDDVEVAVLGVGDPGGEEVLLDVDGGPVPGVLGLNVYSSLVISSLMAMVE